MISRAILSIAIIFLIAPALACACTCSQAPAGKCPGLRPDDVVFLGTVTAIEEIANATPKPADASGSPVDIIASRLTRYHFHIDERFAGPDSAEIDVFAGGDDDGDCGYRFKKGTQYVVFTQTETEDRLFATICNGTRPASDARALLPQLRAMGKGQRVASVFGVLRRSDPPFLAPADDPEDPLVNIPLKLRSHEDRFQTSTGPNGVYTFYDVHAGEYSFTAGLPARTELTQKIAHRWPAAFQDPNEACYEYDVVALPTGTFAAVWSAPTASRWGSLRSSSTAPERIRIRDPDCGAFRERRECSTRPCRSRRVRDRLQSHEPRRPQLALSAHVLSRSRRPRRRATHPPQGWAAPGKNNSQAHGWISHAPRARAIEVGGRASTGNMWSPRKRTAD